MAAPFTNTHDSATISTTEYSLLDKTTTSVPIAHSGAVKFSAIIGLAALVAGDEYRFRLYEKVNGQTAAPIWEAYRSGVQAGPLVIPPHWVSEGYDLTGLRTAGADKTIQWSINKDVGDVNLVTWLGNAPAALTAAGYIHTSLIARTGTAQAGGAQTITLDAGASAVDGTYAGNKLLIIAGTGAGQTQDIIAYVGSSKVCTMFRAWATNPDNTSVFVVIGGSTPFVTPVQKTTSTTLTSTLFTTDLTETTTDHHKDKWCRFLTGSLANQVKKVTGYNGSTKALSFSSGFTGAPSSGDLFTLVSG